MKPRVNERTGTFKWAADIKRKFSVTAIRVAFNASDTYYWRKIYALALGLRY